MPDDSDLPEALAADIETLEADGFDINVERTANTAHVIFRNFDLPSKFDPQTTDLLINVPAPRLYPRGTIDMFWTETEVTLQSGEIPEKADYTTSYVGRDWRRFSWHRGDSDDPNWNPAYNDLVDHVEFVQHRLGERN